MKKREQIKQNIKDHLVLYSLGLTMVVAGSTVLIMRSSTTQRGVSVDNTQRALSNTASRIFLNKQTINVTTVLDREGRGHPGWPVKNLETGRHFFSQREAATAFNINEGVLSGHLNGKFPDVDGLHFERMSLPN